MLLRLEDSISRWVTYNQNLLPSNPDIAKQIQAKVSMLQSPTLVSDIIDGRFYSVGSITSRNGRTTPIIAVYPLDSMRTEASDAVQTIELAFPILEDFMAAPYPIASLDIWIGFTMGNTGGPGTINMEDRATYEARTTPGRLLWDAILVHELSHSFIRNESLTQFLEIYVYNVAHTNSTSIDSWTSVRNYVAWRDSNSGYDALLDIYQLIGRDAMANAYRTIFASYTVRPGPPPYPVCAECQAFIDQAPAALRAQVTDKVAKIRW